jgi:glycosyltransferase involved in cell wall biosynthesis
MTIEDFTRNDDKAKEIIMGSDIIVIERNYFSDTLVTMMYYKVRGKTLIGIFDDAYDLIEPENPAYTYWHQSKADMVGEDGVEHPVTLFPYVADMFVWGIQLVKAVQMPSTVLAADWAKFADTIYVPNYIETEKYLDVKPLFPHEPDEIYLGWAGSLSHFRSFEDTQILRALKHVLRKHDNVKLLLAGDRRVYDAIDISPKRKMFSPFVPEEDFPRLLKSFDVAFAPLDNRPFDKRRSRIKVLEYMALQVPWIASDNPTYNEFKDMGLGMFAEANWQSWEEKLEYAIDNVVRLKEEAKLKPFEYAMTQSYDANIGKTLDLYRQLIQMPYHGYYQPFVPALAPKPQEFPVPILVPTKKINAPVAKKEELAEKEAKAKELEERKKKAEALKKKFAPPEQKPLSKFELQNFKR